nr:hypothetical protein 3 [bacterium]
MIAYEFTVGEKVDFDSTAERSEYTKMVPVWKRCRDANSGGVEIKANGETYLPKLNLLQSTSDYNDYKDRAYWYGATGKTVAAFLGMIFRKPPVVTAENEIVEEIIDVVTQDGRSYEELLRQVVEEIIIVNRVGVLEDYPQMTDEKGIPIQMSQLDAEKIGLRSYTTIYQAEDIINWKLEVVGNELVPTFFVLHETEDEENPENPIYPELVHFYRILYLQETEEGVVYRQVLLKEHENEYYVEQVYTPMKNGKFLTRIPFWVLNEDGIEYESVEVPVIYDLVEINLAHYRNSADYEREIHKISIKTAIFPGWNKQEHGEPEIGGALATPPDQKPFILESAQSSPLKDEMTKKEERMATIGAQLLAQKGRYVQAAKTAEIQSRGESSVVASIARSVGLAFSEIFVFKVEWSGLKDPEVSIALNTDFEEGRYEAGDLKALFELLQGNAISFDVFFNALNKLEMYPSGWSKEQEIEAIRESQDMLTGLGDEKFENLQAQINEIQAPEEEQALEE